MDVVSHLLVGRILQAAAGVEGRRAQVVTVVCAALPDLPSAVVYPLVGHANGRPFWIPLHADWAGLHVEHSLWAAFWDAPHSLLFWAAIVVPVLLLLRARWPEMPVGAAALAYASHLLVDFFVHTGEWALRPLFPLAWAVDGVTDAWLWPPWAMLISWGVALGALIALRVVKARWSQRRCRIGRTL